MASTSESPTDLPYETIVLPAPITYKDFTWTPAAHPPRILIGKKIKQSSSATIHPPIIGWKRLLKVSPRLVDQHRLIYGWAVDIGALQKQGEVEGYLVNEIGKANVIQRFRMILHNVCGLHPENDFLPVLLSDGSSQEKAQKVMMLLATSTYPRWYRYAWDIDHLDKDTDEDEDENKDGK